MPETLDRPGPNHPIALESPASIAIVGAGPIGLEAALYAKFLGYVVTVFERGQIAQHVKQWEHCSLLTPFQNLHSRLGRSAILAQRPDYQFPDAEALSTGAQWREHYLLPLAATDLVASTIQEQCQVISISRCQSRKQHVVPSVERWQDGFQIVWRTTDGRSHCDTFDFVLDASGTFQQSQGWGPGGGLALGQQELQTQCQESAELRSQLHFATPPLANNPDDWRGKRVLLLGDSLIAAQTAIHWMQVADANLRSAEQAPPAEKSHDAGALVWIMDRSIGNAGIYTPIMADPLPARDELYGKTNRLLQKFLCRSIEANEEYDPLLTRLAIAPNTSLLQISWEADSRQFHVTVRQWTPVDWDTVEEGFEEPDEVERQLTFDHVVVAVGHQVDYAMTRELNIPRCPQTECLMPLQASLQEFSGDHFQFQMTDPNLIRTPEGRYFVLGAKSFARQPEYFYRIGLQQIRDAFRWIVGRADLDLETTVR